MTKSSSRNLGGGFKYFLFSVANLAQAYGVRTSVALGILATIVGEACGCSPQL